VLSMVGQALGRRAIDAGIGMGIGVIAALRRASGDGRRDEAVDAKPPAVAAEPAIAVATTLVAALALDDDMKHDDLTVDGYADGKVADVPVGPLIVDEDEGPLLYHIPQAKPRGLGAFIMANAPKIAPVLEDVDAFEPEQAESVIDEMSARVRFPLSRQSIAAARALITLADAKKAKLDTEREAIEKDVRNIRALLPTFLFVDKLRQTAASKPCKRQLLMAATSCRLEAAKKRSRLL